MDTQITLNKVNFVIVVCTIKWIQLVYRNEFKIIPIHFSISVFSNLWMFNLIRDFYVGIKKPMNPCLQTRFNYEKTEGQINLFFNKKLYTKRPGIVNIGAC